MATATLRGGMRFGRWAGLNNSSWSTSYIQAALVNDELTAIIEAPKTGNITDVLYATDSVGGSTWTIDVRVETVTEATGLSTGTLVNANANKSQDMILTDDDVTFAVTLTAPAAVTQGQKLAIVLKTTTAVGGNTWQMRTFSEDQNTSFAYLTDNNVKSSSAYAPIIGLKYDDGNWYPSNGCFPPFIVGNEAFKNSDSPDIFGNRFVLPYPANCRGVWCQMSPGGQWTARLYSGATVLAQVSHDQGTRGSTTGYTDWNLYWDTSVAEVVSLAKDTAYRVTITPDEATDIILPYGDVGLNAYLGLLPGGVNMYQTKATMTPSVEGDWIDVNDRYMAIGPILDGFDDGAGGGAGITKLAGHGGGLVG